MTSLRPDGILTREDAGAIFGGVVAALASRWPTTGALLAAALDAGANANGADPADGRTLLHHAAQRGNIALARAVLRHDGADANAVSHAGRTPLHEAAYAAEGGEGAQVPGGAGNDQGKYIDVMRALLAAPEPARLEAEDSTGKTPLVLAVENERRAAALELVRRGANVGARAGPDGLTVLGLLDDAGRYKPGSRALASEIRGLLAQRSLKQVCARA